VLRAAAGLSILRGTLVLVERGLERLAESDAQETAALPAESRLAGGRP
jgi:hypothetical protein